MYVVWVEKDGREIHRQRLADGVFTLGRSEDNDIHIAESSVSRHHLRLTVASQEVVVADLGSTNGTTLNGQSLEPEQAIPWSVGQHLQIGPLLIYIRQEDRPVQRRPSDSPPERQPPPVADEPYPGAPPTYTIVSRETVPGAKTLTTQPILVGSDPSCALRITGSRVASHQCHIQLKGNDVEVTNLDGAHPVSIGGNPLPVGEPTIWTANQSLRIGDADLFLTHGPAEAETTDYQAIGQQGGFLSRLRSWRYGLIVIVMGAAALLCSGSIVAYLVQQDRCDSAGPACLLLALGIGSDGQATSEVQGRATPTLAPIATRQFATATPRTIAFATGTALPTAVAAPCEAEDTSPGWLNLPFPYQGTEVVGANRGDAETFRRISQRSKVLGGRINSFFDHEFPVYPPAFGGREPENLASTLVTFAGLRSLDAYVQDSDSGDWYSGHAGIDFAPNDPRRPTTPVLAAYDGLFVEAKIDADGNHLVKLKHDPDGDGRYQYSTHYYHLHPDDYFTATLRIEEGTPIQTGQRIGTMGTTGRSSGIHLHFEVRYDVNGDGIFSIFERVDPYGFFPSQEIAADPWAQPAEWVDVDGTEYEHAGIKSDYLWFYPLQNVDDTSGECPQQTGIDLQVDLYPVDGFAVINPGFTYVAGRNERGEVLESGPPRQRRLSFWPEALEGVDIDTLRLNFFHPRKQRWEAVSVGDTSLEQRDTGQYVFSAFIEWTAPYVLVAREVVDRWAPITRIDLSGETFDEQTNSYVDSVVVTLNPQDFGEPRSGVKEVQYSLDCGRNWHQYSEPFIVTLDLPHACGEAGTGQQGVELDENAFILLALAEDVAGNIEQPPAQAHFRIE